MLALLSLPFICSWFGQVLSSLTPFVLHERRSRSPSGWVPERKHDASAVLPIRFGLKQSNIQNLEEYLYDISDPDSSNFGKHWTPLEVAKTFAPSAESVKVVHEWLIDNGIPKDRLRITPSQGWIEVDATVEEAEHLILADYYVYKHESGQEHIDTSFNNFLDALDGSYCTYEGGDDPTVDAIYPDTQAGGYDGPSACGTTKPAAVISTSYGYNEADLTPFYATRQCNEYAKLGLMGVTILYSSGDSGVAGLGFAQLSSSQSVNGTRFNPSFPGSCPYVTSVGATQIAAGNSVDDPEVAAARVTASGRWRIQASLLSVTVDMNIHKYPSNVFGIPNYQKDAVATYIKNFKTDNFTTSAYNSSGNSRAFPDVAVNGAAYVVAAEGEFILEWGTSASSPTMGSILAMINDARLAIGKSTIGFINPTIYSTLFQEAFNDIRSGNNPGCGTEGFTAASGWDPLTGLGTPNFERLKELWLALP
ncbi:hypothetical protein HHX47_DHR4001018 [Lentinula edodes]|nr:hypothetical protein HHX47_DHR4001018 [Lentinula edodes]